MRPATTSFGIITAFLILWTGPFFHIHDAVDSHGHLAGLDSCVSHVFQEIRNTETRIEKPNRHHAGFRSIVIAGSGHKERASVAEARSVQMIFEPSVLVVFGAESPVRVHDAPSLQNSSPRSPPIQAFARF